MIRVNPEKITEFIGYACVDLKCTSSKAVSYKIKCTSPKKFVVWPRIGTLAPGASIRINVVVQQTKNLAPSKKDKFLFMSMELPDHLDITASPQQISDLWKSIPSKSVVEEYRIRCHTSEKSDGKSIGDTFYNAVSSPKANGLKYEPNNDKLKLISDAIGQLSNQNRRLEKRLRSIQNLMWATWLIVFTLLLAIVYTLKMEIQISCAGCRRSTHI